jgi:hypothetical protein
MAKIHLQSFHPIASSFIRWAMRCELIFPALSRIVAQQKQKDNADDSS